MPPKSTAKAVLFFLIPFALSGCVLRFATEVRADGSGVLTTEIGFNPDDKALLAELADTPVEELDVCGQAASGEALPPGSRFEREERGPDTYCVAHVPFTSLDDLRQRYVAMNAEVHELSLEDDRFRYHVTLDLLQGEDASSLDLIGVTPVVTWELTVPGRLVAHNADEVDGGRLVWQVSLGEPADFRAESDLGVGLPLAGIALGLAVCGGLAVLLAVTGFILWRRSRAV